MAKYDEYLNDFDEFEDISSKSDNYIDDEYEDIDTGRYDYEDDFEYSDDLDGIPMSKQAKMAIDNNIQQKTENRRVSVLKPDNIDDDIDISSNTPKKKKRLSLRKKILRAFGICFLVIILLLGLLILSIYSKLSHAEDSHHVNQYISEDQLHTDKNVINILLLGVDAREGETVSRSDTMMIVSIDKSNGKMKITSFLRDSYVEIPGYGWTKLNAACSQGGVDLVWDTLEYNFKIKIENYMKVDFIAFEKLIDSLGGVNVPITEKEAKYLNETWYEWTLTGNQLTYDSGDSVHLNGEEALMFCRIRKLDSDFERTRRQRDTISGIKQEMMHTNPIELLKLSNSVLPHIETDITSSKMISLGIGAIFKYLHYDIESLGVPIDGTWHSENKSAGSCLVFDIDDTAETLYNYIYNDINPLQ